jgi:hypothetical protein
LNGRLNLPLGDFTLGTRVYGQPDNNPSGHANTLGQDSFWFLPGDGRNVLAGVVWRWLRIDHGR